MDSRNSKTRALIPPALTPGKTAGENRHGRRKQQAIARKERHLFNRYKAHMAQKGYDATFDDFVSSSRGEG